MANIFLTSKCNLKCPYCFADEFVNKNNEVITLDNFKIALDYIKRTPGERVGLIGGEPLLHPEFSEIINMLNKDNIINSYIIYTNGINIDKYIDYIKSDKCNLLINCNSPKDIGDTSFFKLKSNIELISKEKLQNVTLGINLYSQELDYLYIFELLKILKSNKLRFSLSLPNIDKENCNDVLNQFKEFKPYLFEFFKDCIKNDIIPHNDCNGIPHCILNVEEMRILLSIQQKAAKLDDAGTITSIKTCNPVIDILPDLTAVRCFGLSKYNKVNITDFKDLNCIRHYFYHDIDLYAKLSFENEKCINCRIRTINNCGICYTFKLEKINELKNYINSKYNTKSN